MLEQALGLRAWSDRLRKQDSEGKGEKPVSDPLQMKASELILPKLHYEPTALVPALTKPAIKSHLRIHKRYVTKTNELTRGTEYKDMTLQKVVVASAKDNKELFHNASQAWNHAFFWLSISPPGKDTSPIGNLLSAVQKEFKSVEACRNRMKEEAGKLFGSGWLWLVRDGDTPVVLVTKNADSPLTSGVTPIVCLDLWEHVYYLDYQDDREAYVDTAVTDLLNWGFAGRNWEASVGA